jgi:hypothetical protein
MKDHNRPDWTTLITTLGNHISSGNRTEEVDMSMWDTLFPLAKEELCGSDIAQYSAVYQGNRYELFTCVGDPLCINKIIERITLNKKAKQIEWSDTKNTGIIKGRVEDVVMYAIEYNESDYSSWWEVVKDGHILNREYGVNKAKQACQDHLQAYVDGLYLQLQELTQT